MTKHKQTLSSDQKTDANNDQKNNEKTGKHASRRIHYQVKSGFTSSVIDVSAKSK